MKRSKRFRLSVLSLLISSAIVVGAPSMASAESGESSGCPEPSAGPVKCGILSVPENRANPASRTIDLPYAIIPAAEQPASGTPIVAMASELGQSAQGVGQHLSRELGLGTHRDVVVLEQRGGSATEPSLDCPDVTDAWIDSFTTTDDLDDSGAVVGTALKKCLADFVEGGGDPSGYTISQMASDVADLRATLNHPRWTVFGSGWSTKVMSTVASIDAAGTDAVLLDSYSPVDRDLKAESYAGLKASLDDLSARVPGGETDYYAQLMKLAQEFDDDPFTGPVTNPFTGKQRFVELDGSDLVSLLQVVLADPAVTPTIPVLFERLADGRHSALGPFVNLAAEAIGTTNWGQSFTSTCLDQKANWSADPIAPSPAAAAAEGEAAADPVDPPLLVAFTIADSVCAQVPLVPAGIELRVAAAFPQPTLILAGSNDPVTPASSAETVSATLPASQFVSFAGAGHRVLDSSACATRTALTWLDDPSADVTALCDHAEALLPLISPSSVHETSRAASVVNAVGDRNWAELIIPVIFTVFCLLWLLGWLIAVLVRSIRRDRLGMLLASGVTPASGSAFVLVAVVSMWTALAAQPSIDLIGVPPIVPWLGILLGVGLLGLIFVWKLGSRAAALLATLAVPIWLAMAGWFVWIVVLPS